MKPVNGDKRLMDILVVTFAAMASFLLFVGLSFWGLLLYAVIATLVFVKSTSESGVRGLVVNATFGLQFGLLSYVLLIWKLGDKSLFWWFSQTINGDAGLSWLWYDFNQSTNGLFRLLVLTVLVSSISTSVYKVKVAWWAMPLLVGSIRWRQQSGEGWHIKLPFFLERIARFDGGLIQARQLADSDTLASMASDGFFKSAPVPTRGFPGVALGGDETGEAFDQGTGPEITPILELFMRRVNLHVLLGTEEKLQKYPAGAVLNTIKRRMRDFGSIIPYSIFLDLTSEQFTWLSLDDLNKINRKISTQSLPRRERAQMWRDELDKALKRKKPTKAPKWMKVKDFASLNVWKQIQFIEARKANGAYVHEGSFQLEIYLMLGMVAEVQIKDMEQQPDIKKAQEDLADALIQITEDAARGKAKGAAVWAQAAELLGVDPDDPNFRDEIRARVEEVFGTERAIEALAGNKALVVPGQIPNMLRGLLKDASS